jgi:hypothetical protein
MSAPMLLTELVAGAIWLADYPVTLGGARFNARMTVVRRRDGRLVLHSPGPFDAGIERQLRAIGRVGVIVAPSNFHHLHLAACQRAHPEAETWICPGVERKQPGLRYDGFLGGAPPPALAEDFVVAPACVGRIMSEVPMLHRSSRTLVLVDLIENIGDQTPGTNGLLRACWKMVGMWNRARPAPEFRIAGWKDPDAARAALELVLTWDFERIVIAHGDLIERDALATAREAWHRELRGR